MSENDDLNKRTVSIKRTFKAPIKLVWEAWTEPNHIAKWWAPNGTEMTIKEHNFTVGGKWKFSMPMPNGSEFISEGTYLEIVELQKIITTADFRPMTEGVELQAIFEANGEETNFIFNVVHKSEEYRNQQEAMGIYNGWGSAFDRLDTFVCK